MQIEISISYLRELTLYSNCSTLGRNIPISNVLTIEAPLKYSTFLDKVFNLWFSPYQSFSKVLLFKPFKL